ncbi:MAG: hypothetical protein EHM45_06500 [Desulfobacteraceae bacterium]|nr:MAG: hypothetical protein EHM45_06500 [Desulfobacteraceae bacterium]
MIDYAAEFVNYTGAFPDIEAVNVSAPGAGDGTEFIAAMVNDIWGRAQALMNYAGLSPDGVTEADGTAQILDAIAQGYGVGPGIGVIYWKNDTPAVWGDRVLLFQGQEILIATYARLFAAVYCGDATNATAPAFYATNGAGVRTTPGAGGTHFVIPDARGLSLKNIGDATISARVKTGPVSLGSVQEDQMQLLTGSTNDNMVSDDGITYSGVFSDSVQGAKVFAFNAGVSKSTTDTFDFKSSNSPDARTSATTAGNTRDSTLGTNFGITY